MTEGREKYARLAARLLSSQDAQGTATPADTRRDAVVAAMALAMAGKLRRRRIAMAAGMTLAAAAGIALVLRFVGGTGGWLAERNVAPILVVAQTSGTGNRLVRAGAAQPLPESGALAPGDSIRLGRDGAATIAFKDKTQIAISSSSDLRVEALGATRRFMLLDGRVQARVTKLASGERFIIDTPDSEVEVRGTVFSVEVGTPRPGCRSSGNSSSVTVGEGEVLVLSRGSRVLLRPGETWTLPCDGVSAPSAAAAEAAALAPVARTGSTAASAATGPRKIASPRSGRDVAPTVPGADSPARAPVAATPVGVGPLPEAPASHLAEQNDLFSAAMAAEREAKHDIALHKLKELIARFPTGPLSESARAERQRILLASGQR